MTKRLDQVDDRRHGDRYCADDEERLSDEDRCDDPQDRAHQEHGRNPDGEVQRLTRQVDHPPHDGRAESGNEHQQTDAAEDEGEKLLGAHDAAENCAPSWYLSTPSVARRLL